MRRPGWTSTSGPAASPARSPAQPQAAIMAPLSVQRAGRGTRTRTGDRSTRAARRALLAATPPTRTISRAAWSRAAAIALVTRASTPASWEAAGRRRGRRAPPPPPQPLDGGAAREAQPQQPRYLVERLAGGVVRGLAQAAVAAMAGHEHEVCVAGGDDEAEGGVARGWCLLPRRVR